MQGTIVGDSGLHADHRVGEHHKIGTTAGVFNRIARVWIAIVEMRACRRGEVSAGGKSHDADAAWIDRVFVGVGADVANGALGIEQRDRVVILRAIAIGEDEGRHSTVVEPVGNLSSFFIDGEHGVSAARANHDRGVGWILRRQIGREYRLIECSVSHGPGCAIRPQQNWRRGCGCVGRNRRLCHQ